MPPPQVEATHDKQKGFLTIERLLYEPFLAFRNFSGKLVLAFHLKTITDVELRILRSGRIVLDLLGPCGLYSFISVRPADANWGTIIAPLRAVVPAPTTRPSVHASSSRLFPPMEYLMEHQTIATRTACTKSATCTSSSTKEPLELFSLPQELLDIIFCYAYPAEDDTIFVTPQQKEIDVRLNMIYGRAVHALQPLTPKVCAFMVSRRFYKEASRAWVQNQHIRDDSFHPKGQNAFSMANILGRRTHPNDIIGKYLTKASLKYFKWCQGSALEIPHLLHLTLMMTEDAFDVVKPQYAWQTPLEKSHFEAVVASSQFLDKLRGLKSLKLVAGDIKYLRTTAQEDQWKENVAGLEAFMIPLVTRLRLKEAAEAIPKIPLRQRSAAEMSMTSNMPLGVCMTRFGMVITPGALQPKNIDQLQDFIRGHSEAVVAEIEELRLDELVAAMSEMSLTSE